MSGTNSDMDVGVSRDAVSATTLPTWGTMTAEERANPQYLGEIEKLYKKRIDSTKADDERSDLLNSLAQITEGRQAALRTAETRVKDIEKELDRVDKADKSEARLLRYKGFVRKHEIYYVATEHVFMQYFPDRGDWCQLRPEALYMQYSISYGDDMEAFQKALADLGRKKMTVECSFYPKPDRVLNLMRRDHWLKPTSGEPHYAFNLLTRSLGNGKDENTSHIEQVVYWKYTHPEEYRLPCLVIYGEGGAGKNTFVKEVLGTIFGAHQVLVADADKTLGQFNGLIQGKTVVMIDEAVADKINSERLKRMVGNRTIDINPKYGKQGEHDNTPLYFAGGNDTTGAILLAGDATDRRWSILKVDKSIIQRLADDKGIGFDEALKEYDSIKHIYTSPTEVAKWLNYIIKKWEHLTSAPVGLHHEDYRQLLDTQKSPFEDILEMVFIEDDSFDYIDGGSLYELYKEFSQVVNPAARGVLGRNKFLGKAEEWVRRKALPIERGQVKIVLGEDIKKQSSTTGFYRLPGHRVFRGNKDKYKKALGRTPFWERARVEPRLALVDPAQALEGVENVGDLDKLQRLQAREKEKAEARRQKSRKKISDEPAKKRQVPPNALKILEKM